MRAILVGSGRVARELLRRLGDLWVVTVVDPSHDRLAEARKVRSVPVVRGDGSSRVVLKRAGLESADALIAATDDDDTNLEACRLARDAGIARLAAVANIPGCLNAYRELGVTAVSPHSLAARRMELGLERRRIASMAFADGRAEAVEFRIEGDSPVRGRSLQDLHSTSWIVGAVLRDDRLIIPHGETVFEAGDLVTVIGAAADFSEMIRTFTSGEGRFPLDFGKRVLVPLERESDLNGLFTEATHLVRGSRASSLLVVHRDPRAVRNEAEVARIAGLIERASERADGVAVRLRAVSCRPLSAVAAVPGHESIGVIVVRGPEGRGLASWSRALRAAGLVRRTGRPVLLARGSQPYRRILVPARKTSAGRAAMRAAIDLARFSKAKLIGVAVVDPIFISGPGAPEDARRSIAWLEEEAAVHGVRVRGTIERGNPARVLRRAGEQANLIVLGAGARSRPVRYVARGSTRSVLLVPA